MRPIGAEVISFRLATDLRVRMVGYAYIAQGEQAECRNTEKNKKTQSAGGRCRICDMHCVNCAGIQALPVLLWQCWLWRSEQARQFSPLLMRRWSGHFPIGSHPASLRCSSGFRLATATTSQTSTIAVGSSGTGYLSRSTFIVRTILRSVEIPASWRRFRAHWSAMVSSGLSA